MHYQQRGNCQKKSEQEDPVPDHQSRHQIEVELERPDKPERPAGKQAGEEKYRRRRNNRRYVGTAGHASHSLTGPGSVRSLFYDARRRQQ